MEDKEREYIIDQMDEITTQLTEAINIFTYVLEGMEGCDNELPAISALYGTQRLFINAKKSFGDLHTKILRTHDEKTPSTGSKE